MSTKNHALNLFRTMYEERTIRDRLYEVVSLCGDQREADTLQALATQHNAASNRAMMALQDLGYCAYRDDQNDDTPTLRKAGQVVAYWDEYEGVTEATPFDHVDGCTATEYDDGHTFEYTFSRAESGHMFMDTAMDGEPCGDWIGHRCVYGVRTDTPWIRDPFRTFGRIYLTDLQREALGNATQQAVAC